MIRSRQITAVGSTVLICSIVSAALLTRAVDRARPTASLQEMLYVSSPKLLKRLSLGYTGLLADIYWTRAVQYFGYQHYEHSTDFHLLAPLLKIAVELDPKLVPAYQFGSNFLSPKPPNGAGEPEKALELARAFSEN